VFITTLTSFTINSPWKSESIKEEKGERTAKHAVSKNTLHTILTGSFLLSFNIKLSTATTQISSVLQNNFKKLTIINIAHIYVQNAAFMERYCLYVILYVSNSNNPCTQWTKVLSTALSNISCIESFLDVRWLRHGIDHPPHLVPWLKKE